MPTLNKGDAGEGTGKIDNSLFLKIRWTTVKLYNLPNYICLRLSDNTGCDRR